jgi:hypothetical protein
MAQIVVEVAELRPKQSEDPGLACALAETLDAVPAGGIGIGRDVEATAAGREGEAGEVIGRGGGGYRQRRHHGAERGHRLEAFAGGHDRDRSAGLEAEPDAVAQQVTERAAGSSCALPPQDPARCVAGR